jgi:hypothetical protein
MAITGSATAVPLCRMAITGSSMTRVTWIAWWRP